MTNLEKYSWIDGRGAIQFIERRLPEAWICWSSEDFGGNCCCIHHPPVMYRGQELSGFEAFRLALRQPVPLPS